MPREILTAISPGAGAPPQITPLILDDPAPDEMVIEVRAAGVCHTDLGVADWLTEPRVLGHEGAGVVVDVGTDVTEFAVGDRVLATFGYCGKCSVCDAGRPAYCVDGAALNIEGARAAGRPSLRRPTGEPIAGSFFQQSCFATYAIVTKRNAVKIPDGVDFVTAAPFGCGVQTGAGAVLNQLGLKAGFPMAVIGCGAVGLSAIMAGKILGCDPIIAFDVVEDRCELALEMGATHGFKGDIEKHVREVVPEGVAAVLDTAGAQITFEQSLQALRPGGSLGVLTIPGEFEDPIPHPGGMPFMTTNIIGIVEGDSVPNEFLPHLFDQFEAGQMPVDRLIETFPFENIAGAFEAMTNSTAIKPVLTFGA